ncbi:MAG: biotin/lipoate A/B protein ligase family protein [Chthoniobacterales bacterium]
MRTRAKQCSELSARLRAKGSSRTLVLHELHVYRERELRSAAMNMAIDEALFKYATAPSLRFYGWKRPSLSFGYFGAYADVAAEESGRDLVRRWTGGGIVLHGEDLTYSIILPFQQEMQPQPSRVVYNEVHGAIQRALSGIMDVALATQDAPKISDLCFANPVRSDVLLAGRKIAGAAQRRTRAGLLHQGSIQCDALLPSFENRFASALCPHFEPRVFSEELLERAQLLATQKYETVEWLRQR